MKFPTAGFSHLLHSWWTGQFITNICLDPTDTSVTLVFYYHEVVVLEDGYHVAEVAGQPDSKEPIEAKLSRTIDEVWSDPTSCGPPEPIVDETPRYEPLEICRRARYFANVWNTSGQKYRLFYDNCQNFTRWCISGRYISPEIERLVSEVADVPIVRAGRAAVGGGLGYAIGHATATDDSSSKRISGALCATAAAISSQVNWTVLTLVIAIIAIIVVVYLVSRKSKPLAQAVASVGAAVVVGAAVSHSPVKEAVRTVGDRFASKYGV